MLINEHCNCDCDWDCDIYNNFTIVKCVVLVIQVGLSTCNNVQLTIYCNHSNHKTLTGCGCKERPPAVGFVRVVRTVVITITPERSFPWTVAVV